MSFDVDSFLDTTVTEENSTFTIPVPVGEYLANTDAVKIVPWSKKDGSDSGLKLQITWVVEDEGVKALLERDKVTVRQDIMLDLTADGKLDMGKGKNVALGRVRAALDLNSPGKPFSFTMIPGRMAKIMVGHRDNPQVPESPFIDIKGVAKAA